MVDAFFRKKLPTYLRVLIVLSVLMVVRHFYNGNIESFGQLSTRIAVVAVLFSMVFWFFTFVSWFESGDGGKEHDE